MALLCETWRRCLACRAALLPAGLAVGAVAACLGLIGQKLLPPMISQTALEDAWAWLSWPTPAVLALLWLLGTLLTPLAAGLLFQAAIQAQRRQPPSLAQAWEEAVERYRPMLNLVLLLQATACSLAVVGGIMALVPVLGPLVWAVGAGMASVALAGYGPLLVLAEGLDARAALRKSIQILQECSVDLLLAALVLAAALGGLWWLAGWAGRLAALGSLFFWTAAGPLSAVYLALRYQAHIAPAFAPAGGEGAFHRDPPVGV